MRLERRSPGQEGAGTERPCPRWETVEREKCAFPMVGIAVGLFYALRLRIEDWLNAVARYKS